VEVPTSGERVGLTFPGNKGIDDYIRHNSGWSRLLTRSVHLYYSKRNLTSDMMLPSSTKDGMAYTPYLLIPINNEDRRM
jgi:hypothetical protein